MCNLENFFKLSNIYNYWLTCRRRTIPCMMLQLQTKKYDVFKLLERLMLNSWILHPVNIATITETGSVDHCADHVETTLQQT